MKSCNLEIRVDEEGGWWEGERYYDAWGGMYDENGVYSDQCKERVTKLYTKDEIKTTKKRITSRNKNKHKHKDNNIWKTLSFYERECCLVEDWGKREEVLDEDEEDEDVKVVLVKGSFGICYNRRIDKTKEEIEEEERLRKSEPWGMSVAEAKLIEKNKKERYEKGLVPMF